MHAVGLHSALAIKRQRKRRDEQRRARERRYSSQSGDSGLTSPRVSSTSLDHPSRRHHRNNLRQFKNGVDSQFSGMLHIGIVFLILGFFLLLSGVLQNDLTSWKNFRLKKLWNELIAIGSFFLSLGVLLLIINRILTKKEEADLEKYVQCQLTRSKSGHRLEIDTETGGLTTKQAKRIKSLQTQEITLNVIDKTVAEKKDSIESPSFESLKCTLPITNDNTTEQSNLFLEKIIEEEYMSEPNLINISDLNLEKIKKNEKTTVNIYHPCDSYTSKAQNLSHFGLTQS